MLGESVPGGDLEPGDTPDPAKGAHEVGFGHRAWNLGVTLNLGDTPDPAKGACEVFGGCRLADTVDPPASVRAFPSPRE